MAGKLLRQGSSECVLPTQCPCHKSVIAIIIWLPFFKHGIQAKCVEIRKGIMLKINATLRPSQFKLLDISQHINQPWYNDMKLKPWDMFINRMYIFVYCIHMLLLVSYLIDDEVIFIALCRCRLFGRARHWG